jgi:precorrin-2 dehydrogenase/sirohydrochlorin ferrochelatase
MHDFSDEAVLVVGGGAVGARKARRFGREARVVVISPEFPGADYGADGGGSVELIQAAPDPAGVVEWIDRVDPALVVAATDDSAVNDAAERAARDGGRLVNRADQAGSREVDSVVVPATVREDPVTVAISTGGRSPALSRALRERIEAEIEGAGAMAELSAELRTEFKEAAIPPEDRREALRAVVRSPPVWKALRVGADKGRQEAERVIETKRGEDK